MQKAGVMKAVDAAQRRGQVVAEETSELVEGNGALFADQSKNLYLALGGLPRLGSLGEQL